MLAETGDILVLEPISNYQVGSTHSQVNFFKTYFIGDNHKAICWRCNLRLSSLSRCTFVARYTRYTMVVEGCQNKKYKYLLKNNITIFKLQNFTAMDT